MNLEVLTHLGIYGLISYMLFVIGMMVREAKVPQTGVIWVFVVLGAGFTGWIIKDIIRLFLE